MSEISKLNPLTSAPLADKKPQVTEEKFREVAEMYEKHFIREMMKEMRSTVHESGFIKKNNAEKIFQDQLDDQYADSWGKTGGFGLADLIHNQLMERYGTQLGLKDKIQKPEGPIELNHKANLTTLRVPPVGGSSQGSSLVTQLKFDFQDSEKNKENKPVALKSPWAGTLLDKKYLEMDQMQYRIKHDNGLESLILTRGSGLGSQVQSAAKLSVGDEIKTGQQLGWLDSTSPLFWTIKPSVSE
ncbi:MAG: hypothetical protein A2622_03395 [Bdellovibrionales bacterium RIFCSPHIGHO2_01_FULL_40_29]|nr:MAG: hypothetical protein A2622_03395 [Bdellovibrionales bacterium RIFCSPHIGHO2_01_FULL_40_29]OFZ34113.1 MAG: hypothetical protein A3D17_03815 [Bdellovibrionales bacterium RIFCSPHIGHO2_02_FULL_40_15]